MINTTTKEDKMENWESKMTETKTPKGVKVEITVTRFLVSKSLPQLGYSDRNYLVEWDCTIDNKNYDLHDPRISGRVPEDTRNFLTEKTDEFLREIGLKKSKEEEQKNSDELFELEMENTRLDNLNSGTY